MLWSRVDSEEIVDNFCSLKPLFASLVQTSVTSALASTHEHFNLTKPLYSILIVFRLPKEIPARTKWVLIFEIAHFKSHDAMISPHEVHVFTAENPISIKLKALARAVKFKSGSFERAGSMINKLSKKLSERRDEDNCIPDHHGPERYKKLPIERSSQREHCNSLVLRR